MERTEELLTQRSGVQAFFKENLAPLAELAPTCLQREVASDRAPP